ncbi:MAG: hypothetical protein HIU84_04195 [Acidobacteria bacterium]|nr:hypothetical protein [Acidobacteriota bacterium]
MSGRIWSAISSPRRDTALLKRGVLSVVLIFLALSMVTISPATASTRGTHPSAPRYVRAVPGNHSMTVLFAPPASIGGYRVTRYVVDVHPANRRYTCRFSDCSLHNLKNGVTYFFTVAAVNQLGRGPFSARSNAVIPEPPRPVTATVTFNANGCSGTMPSESETLGTSAPLTPNAFTCTGYNFTGWNTASNGSGTSYADGATYRFAASVILYAQWTATPVSTSFLGQVSSNWSGYVLPTSTIVTSASGQWTVPTLNCASTPNGNSATWVGTGGWGWSTGGSSGVLLQTGITDNCVNGVQQDSGWWEMVPSTPNNEEMFSNFTVSPGDSIVAEVYQSSSGQWVTVVQDLTTGLQGVMETGNSWYVTTIANNTIIGDVQGDTTGLSYSGGYTTEWIMEDPTNASSGSMSAFANYGSVGFTNLETNLSSWSLPTSDGVEIVQNGVTLSVPSAVNGTGFTVSYTGP